MAVWAWLWVWLWAWACVPLSAATPFNVYWNVPSEVCAKYGVRVNVSQFGVVQNANDAFHGDKVNIFYKPGAFPYLVEGRPVNGGIPQNGSMTTHVQRFINEINEYLPPHFDGVAVLDFEAYFPSYAMSASEYRTASRQWVRALHPTWPYKEIERVATESFNHTAREFFQVLLWVGRELRPDALWGYYHYPYCQNYLPSERKCRIKVKQHNEEMQWLFKMSSALYPSVYISKGRDFDAHTRRRHIRAHFREALRMRSLVNSTAPILPYMWYRYRDSLTYLSPMDMLNTLGQARMGGVDGAVVWGGMKDMASKEQCLSLKNYAEGRLGPLVRYLACLPRAKLRRILASRLALKRTVRKALRSADGIRRGQCLPLSDNHITL